MHEGNHYSPLTMTKGAALFKWQTQAIVDSLIIELDLEEQLNLPSELSKEHKVNRIVQYTKKNPDHQTMEGSSLTNGIVEKAAELAGIHKASMEGRSCLQGFCQSAKPGRVHIGRKRDNPPNTSRSGRLTGGR